MLNHCKAALHNLIASERVQQLSNPLEAFSEGVTNLISFNTTVTTPHVFLVSSYQGKLKIKKSYSVSRVNICWSKHQENTNIKQTSINTKQVINTSRMSEHQNKHKLSFHSHTQSVNTPPPPPPPPPGWNCRIYWTGLAQSNQSAPFAIHFIV